MSHEHEQIKDRLRGRFRDNLSASRILQRKVRACGEDAVDHFYVGADGDWLERLPDGSALGCEQTSGSEHALRA